VTLDHLWAGWRHPYVTGAAAGGPDASIRQNTQPSGPPAADNGVVWRGDTALAVLNAYPYASGHLLVMPRRHVAGFDDLEPGESAELWAATQRAVAAVDAAYRPDGMNLGANLGRAAGAGIPQHLHLHVVPRWSGDTNFMTAVAGVRVIPEALDDSWRRLHGAWPAA